jgi:hypothetical protein
MKFRQQEQEVKREAFKQFGQADFLVRIFEEKELEHEVSKKVKREAAKAMKEAANGTQTPVKGRDEPATGQRNMQFAPQESVRMEGVKPDS